MAPTDNKKKDHKFVAKAGNWKKPQNTLHGVNKRKWVPDNKVFEGSVKEGQGFALKRKEKVRHEYNKLLRKEKRRTPASKALYKEEYPEHLRHLYVAEAEKLRNEAWTHRLNRTKQRLLGQEKREETAEDDAPAEAAEPVPEDAGGSEQTDAGGSEQTDAGGSEQTDAGPVNSEPAASSEKDCLPMSNRMRKKMQKKTSYEKTKEEFESVEEKRKKKKEEFLTDKQQRDEAIKKYKQKKEETFQILNKKTKKGQPNLNLQMEYLLQKITQGAGK
ncbi:thyroid transcription factor 1-associated protein 26 homolog isoform X2 [Gymnodraco acuticeps]|uniref:Thyroid transcription factor 1-associated protein 26 homolog isoform X2 n=1 Tax=Gymnodraco acuticeps TaxID=8218 RepID=A0A6P8URC0_GYMAC|nr:thyroid transcription factor 1-associated protein 26 homolog isoform X2 [Gymnodraco acuticeps]